MGDTTASSFLRLRDLVAIALLSLGSAGCLTDAAVRRGLRHDDLRSIEAASLSEAGDVTLDLRAGFGTFGLPKQVLLITATELEAAHALHGTYLLPRSAIRTSREATASATQPVPIEVLSPYAYGWTSEELASLRPPQGADQAFFYQGRMPFALHARKLRFAHVRRVAPEDFSVAVFELVQSSRGRNWAYLLATPATAVLDAFRIVLITGLAFALAPLAG